MKVVQNHVVDCDEISELCELLTRIAYKNQHIGLKHDVQCVETGISNHDSNLTRLA